jgi:hypothetical protein
MTGLLSRTSTPGAPKRPRCLCHRVSMNRKLGLPLSRLPTLPRSPSSSSSRRMGRCPSADRIRPRWFDHGSVTSLSSHNPRLRAALFAIATLPCCPKTARRCRDVEQCRAEPKTVSSESGHRPVGLDTVCRTVPASARRHRLGPHRFCCPSQGVDAVRLSLHAAPEGTTSRLHPGRPTRGSTASPDVRQPTPEGAGRLRSDSAASPWKATWTRVARLRRWLGPVAGVRDGLGQVPAVFAHLRRRSPEGVGRFRPVSTTVHWIRLPFSPAARLRRWTRPGGGRS